MTRHRRRAHGTGHPTVGAARRRLPLAALVPVGAVLLLAGCSSGPASAPATTAPSTSTAAGPGTGVPAQIDISNFMFLPATLTVEPGTKVTVVNHDDVAHTVTSTSGAFDTGDIAPGSSVVFSAPVHAGDFSYICNIHQYMTGELVVS